MDKNEIQIRGMVRRMNFELLCVARALDIELKPIVDTIFGLVVPQEKREKIKEKFKERYGYDLVI